MKELSYYKGYYEVDFGLTMLFNQIYGEEEYYNFKESASLVKYKKQFSKLIITIKKSFLDSCKDTDKQHQLEVEKIVDNQLQKIKSNSNLEELYRSMMVFFPRLCFLLIGQIPQNSNSRLKDNRNNWKLTDFRKLEYTQTQEQKFELICSLLKNKDLEELDTYKVEFEKYQKTKNSNERFIDWFHRTYPEIYMKLFNRKI